MSAESFVSELLKSFSQVVEPLTDALTPLAVAPPSTNELAALLADFGWTLPGDSDAMALATALGSLATDAETLVTDAQQLDPDSSSDEITHVLTDLAKVLADITNLAAAGANLQFTPFDQQSFWNGPDSFPVLLWPYLVHRYLQKHLTIVYGALRFLGILSETPVTPQAPVAVSGQIEYLRRDIDWSLIPRYATKAGDTFSSVYHWNDPATPLDHVALIQGLAALAGSFPIATGVDPPSPEVGAVFYPGNVPSNLLQLSAAPVPALEMSGPAELILKLVLGVIPIPVSGGNRPDPVGLALFPVLTGAATAKFQVTDLFYVQIDGHAQTIPVIVEFRPLGGGVEAKVNPVTLASLAAQTQIDATVTFGGKAPDGSSWILVGSAASSHLELAAAHLAVTAQGPIDELTYQIEAGFEGCKVVIDLGDGDNFLQSTMGSAPQSIDLSCTLAWSRQRGFSFNGQAELSTTIPIHQSLGGVVELDSILIALRAGTGAGSAALVVAISGGVTLGPIAAVVEQIGVRLEFKPNVLHKGNLGDFDLGFGFQPPNGLGFSIDAGAVAGGGFVLFDEEKGEYAGFLDISIAEIIQVKFIAILDTKLPDGSNGFSLLFIIFLALPPIQLGYGFTLNGVGGIAGVNRTMVVQAMQTGLHNHTLEFLINPPHTVADAPTAISAIGTFFPPALGRYLFGPILALGWETFIQLTVGVVLEVPDPIRLALLGIIDIALPSIEAPEEAVVFLHIDVLGTLDFGTKKLGLDGSLYGSRILEFPILGDFALRTSWGINPSSLFSMGGFNPHFDTTGLDVPPLHRMSISIGDGDNPQISANSYLALTSNTIQFGADVEAYLSEGGLTVHGYLGFDLLIVIKSPTIFLQFDFSAGFDVTYQGTTFAGLNLTGTLTGTTPWHIHGDATLHLLCFSVSKSVDRTWGQVIVPQPAPQAILPDLLPALADPQNWNAVLPDAATSSVTLSASQPPDAGAILVHPMGTLVVREKVVPLDLSIAHYKSGPPADGNYFSLKDVTINGVKVAQDAFTDFFAAGQFLDLSDADKLSRSSFEPYHAGAKIAASTINSGAESTRTVAYDEYYIDDPIAPMRISLVYVMPVNVYTYLSYQSAGFQSSMKNTGLGKYKTGAATPAVLTKALSYVVTNVEDLSVVTAITGTEMTYYQARAALQAHLEGSPQDAGNLQIVPTHEALP
jgi:uncharacterized protein DUF6603